MGAQRHLFEIPEGVAYFNCAYLSPQLRAVTEAGQRGVARKARPWEITAPDFFEGAEALRGSFARLIGAGADDVALVPSVSYGAGVAAANLPLAAGQRVVVLHEQFPSNVHPWRVAAQAVGAEVVVAPRAVSGWGPSVVERIDARTAIVALPACHWTDGTRVELEAVAARAREVGAALVLDLTQSLGAEPFSVAGLDPDFVMAAAYKWLLGPYGMAFLYVAPRHQGGRPLEEGWLARAGSQDFAGLVAYRDDYQPGARRFDVGQRSNFATIPMAQAALDQIEAWGGPSAISSRLGQLTARLEVLAARLGLEVAGPRVAHMIGLRLPGGAPSGLAAQLAARQIHVSVRGDAVRVSPHLHVTEDDLTRFEGVLEESLRAGGGA